MDSVCISIVSYLAELREFGSFRLFSRPRLACVSLVVVNLAARAKFVFFAISFFSDLFQNILDIRKPVSDCFNGFQEGPLQLLTIEI